ncbi:MAG: HPr(Ser) kinase/phosphatase [Eubacteriaceae bacterium]|nr:HPr(Ser) kinase/phosphatase [Eubacteriaceae bacterium]
MREISVEQFCKDLDLEVVCDGGNEYIYINNSGINRPGLQLYGFYKHFDSDRVQMIGNVEISYLKNMSWEDQRKRVEKFFAHTFPCLIVAWNLELDEMFCEYSKKYKITVFKSKLETSKITSKVMNYLDDFLAPSMPLHGQLVEVFGIGILITGESGIGKSETTLELIKSGHRLIADDVIEVKRVGDVLIGSAPLHLKQYMEVRGIGIIDIRTLYGIGAVKETSQIDLLIDLEKWDNDKCYDTLGLENEVADLLGVSIPKLLIPVKTGRNLAIIIEVAARNRRLKNMGIYSAREFFEKIRNFDEGVTKNPDRSCK